MAFYLDGDQLALNDEGYAVFEVSDRPGRGAGASSFKPAQGQPVGYCRGLSQYYHCCV
ncbi:MAG TPA: hypothetical protein V6D18_02070 [Thermosynechococcaceae cyanobacterium]